MTTRTYPYKAWTLTPSFKPVEVELVGLAWNDWGSYAHWDKSGSGKSYDSTKLHATKDAAIAAGFASLDEQRKKLEKMQATIDKRHAALHKASE
jgi:hypothetical protein